MQTRFKGYIKDKDIGYGEPNPAHLTKIFETFSLGDLKKLKGSEKGPTNGRFWECNSHMLVY